MTAPASRLPRVASPVERKDKVLNFILFMVAAVTAATLVLSAVALPQIITGTTNSKAQVRSDRLTACRSSYRADIDTATLDLAVATARAQSLLARAIGAAVTQDRELLRNIGFELLAIDEDKERALGAVGIANQQYKDAVMRSTRDPEKFVQQCQARDQRRSS